MKTKIIIAVFWIGFVLFSSALLAEECWIYVAKSDKFGATKDADKGVYKKGDIIDIISTRVHPTVNAYEKANWDVYLVWLTDAQKALYKSENTLVIPLPTKTPTITPMPTITVTNSVDAIPTPTPIEEFQETYKIEVLSYRKYKFDNSVLKAKVGSAITVANFTANAKVKVQADLDKYEADRLKLISEGKLIGK